MKTNKIIPALPQPDSKWLTFENKPIPTMNLQVLKEVKKTNTNLKPVPTRKGI